MIPLTLEHNNTLLFPPVSYRRLSTRTTADPMERLGGPAAATRLRRHNNHRSPPTADSFLAMFQPPSSAPSTSPQPLELSEDDIFSTASGGSPPPSTRPFSDPKTSPDPSTPIARSSYGILAALNDNHKTGSGLDNRPVVNRKTPVSASLTSSLSFSSASSTSSRILIPRPPPPPSLVDRVRLPHQSAPMNVPVMPAELRRRARDLKDIVSEGEDEEDANGVILPPHEVVASKYSPMLSCSVLEGAGRTLKGRDLRQVRNAVWRQTGFMD